MTSGGFFDGFANALPYFTVVFAKYCDGSSLTGDRDDVVYYEDNTSQPVWYRGRRVLDALFVDDEE